MFLFITNKFYIDQHRYEDKSLKWVDMRKIELLGFPFRLEQTVN